MRSRGAKATAREVITAASTPAVASAFKKKVIIQSFANCNLWPFSPDKILEAAEVNIGEVIVKLDSKETTYDSKAIQEKVADIWAKKAQREKRLINDVKKTTKRVGMTVKYGELSSVEKILVSDQKRKHDAAVLAEADHEIAVQKMVDKEIKLRAKEEKVEAAARKREEKAAEVERKKFAKANPKPKEARGQKRKRAVEESSEESEVFLCNVMACEEEWHGSDDWRWCDHCLKYGVCLQHWNHKDGVAKALMRDHEHRCGVRRTQKQRKE